MIRYTVTWHRDAEQDLASLWMSAAHDGTLLNGHPISRIHVVARPTGQDLRTTTDALHAVQAAGCHVVRCEIDERQLAAY